MKSYRIVGRGGQGVITLGKVLTQAIVYSGENGIMSEIHGLSQRGGGVVTDVKAGDSRSPLIMTGTADYIISMDRNEAISNMAVLRKGGICITGSGAESAFSENTYEGFRCMEFNPSKIEPGLDPRGHNMLLLGIFSAMDPFPSPEFIEKSIAENFSEKVANANIEAFRKGRGYFTDMEIRVK
ncbi:MAG: 2-oxoacid:acceptor oxidoreductase family protein [Candidatus Thermoplasmatota archaeon]|jgi:indolepyruvate ferredoxin oxidoreductase beta subunit|nr:2-oxoacid:acceptor oxidoreductase family protein [Candidatus Thermoplasmatota archaeon]MCL5790831.1 2-oxoacid:acceptor oxidoreductase family protein [Candidatus Thermoplasmatota archaeon]